MEGEGNENLLKGSWKWNAATAARAREDGIFFQTGKWTVREEDQLYGNIDRYLRGVEGGEEGGAGGGKDQVRRRFQSVLSAQRRENKSTVPKGRRRKGSRNEEEEEEGESSSLAFWREISRGIHRPLLGVYKHVYRRYGPGTERAGEEYSREEDAKLRVLVGRVGHRWGEIGEELGRSANSVGDRWRVLREEEEEEEKKKKKKKGKEEEKNKRKKGKEEERENKRKKGKSRLRTESGGSVDEYVVDEYVGEGGGGGMSEIEEEEEGEGGGRSSKVKGKFSWKEDVKLLQIVEKELLRGEDTDREEGGEKGGRKGMVRWRLVAHKMAGRGERMCRERYETLVSRYLRVLEMGSDDGGVSGVDSRMRKRIAERWKEWQKIKEGGGGGRVVIVDPEVLLGAGGGGGGGGKKGGSPQHKMIAPRRWNQMGKDDDMELVRRVERYGVALSRREKALDCVLAGAGKGGGAGADVYDIEWDKVVEGWIWPGRVARTHWNRMRDRVWAINEAVEVPPANYEKKRRRRRTNSDSVGSGNETDDGAEVVKATELLTLTEMCRYIRCVDLPKRRKANRRLQFDGNMDGTRKNSAMEDGDEEGENAHKSPAKKKGKSPAKAKASPVKKQAKPKEKGKGSRVEAKDREETESDDPMSDDEPSNGQRMWKQGSAVTNSETEADSVDQSSPPSPSRSGGLLTLAKAANAVRRASLQKEGWHSARKVSPMKRATVTVKRGAAAEKKSASAPKRKTPLGAASTSQSKHTVEPTEEETAEDVEDKKKKRKKKKKEKKRKRVESAEGEGDGDGGSKRKKRKKEKKKEKKKDKDKDKEKKKKKKDK
eukprot:Nk52_evm32s2506 gene=Nk52_evmTU32s2506